LKNGEIQGKMPGGELPASAGNTAFASAVWREAMLENQGECASLAIERVRWMQAYI
jgi:hypothetical protein